MKPRLSSSAVAALTLVAILAAPRISRAQDSYSLSGDRVAIYNLAGEVEVVSGSGSDVEVQVSIGGSDGSELVFETGEACGANSLRIIFPDDDIVYPGYRGNSEVQVRPDGTFYGHSNWHRNFDWGCSNNSRNRNDRIRISNRGRGTEAYADLRISIPRGKTVEIYLAVGTLTASNISGTLIVDAGAVTVEASDISGEFFVDTGSGNITLDGAQGLVILDTGSGSVDIENVTGDRLIVDTGSGSVGGNTITVSDLNIDTGSGSVDLDQVRSPDVLVDTGSGSVDLILLGSIDDVTIDTGSGRVNLTLDEEPNARIEVDTGSGGIDIDFPVSVSRWQRSHVVGTIGSGSGRIMIDTGSGGVRVSQR
jgi:lia operon protein LiaG